MLEVLIIGSGPAGLSAAVYAKRAGLSVLEAESVIFCGGGRHQRLNVPGEERLTGKGVSYCVLCDGAFYEGKTAAMIGGGDTALDGVLYLSGICS